MTTNTEVARLFASFEECKFDHQGTEAWRARGLMGPLGYAAWQDFRNAVRRAWESCASSGIDHAANFRVADGLTAWTPEQVIRDAPKNPKGGAPSEDVILTRRAAYLVVMNGDPRKPEIAFAQQYFAAATRTLEVVQKRLVEVTRLEARDKLTQTEKKFQGVLYERDVDGPGIGRIRSKGDEALFGGHTTKMMAEKWDVPKGRPIADFAPEVVVIAKQLGAAITSHNVKTNESLRGEGKITAEHVQNNKSVRTALGERGIVPEKLAGEEDIRKIERRHASEAKKLTAPPKAEKGKSKKA